MFTKSVVPNFYKDFNANNLANFNAFNKKTGIFKTYE